MPELNCRLCSLRNRCIQQSQYASSIKIMMYAAFENRTDTLLTWKRLQRKCLLVEQEQSKAPETGSLAALSKRLRRVQAEKNSKKVAASSPVFAKTNGWVGIEELGPGHRRRAQQNMERTSDVSQLERKHLTNFLKLPSTDTVIDDAITHWLTIEGTWRHIALPIDGSLVLGRCDPNIGMAPDIDLAYEDEQKQLISRRHMSIVGERGRHVIEDLGSIYGVLLNDEKIGLRPSRPLRNGDRITLGTVRLIYDRIPAQVFSAFNQKWIRHTLTVTSTGQKRILTPSGPVMIGRADRKLGFVPDIDLSQCGQIAQRVSRRHAQIIWQNGKPYVEDIGSGLGTRLHGTLLPLGETKPLLPGDHIWLAGCVLAYDIEVPETLYPAEHQPGQVVPQAPWLEHIQLQA
jgi:pSer/pThr/pTyr-binding forkhead associated (FHA) protein